LRALDAVIALDDELLEEQLRESLQRIVQLLQWRAAIESVQIDTPDRELFLVALHDKEKATLERAFWLMGLRHPAENFALVWRGLRSGDAGLHAASVEVLEAVLVGPSREALLAIIDDGVPLTWRVRAAAAALGIAVRPLSQREAIDALIADEGEIIRKLNIL
jgi:hypothetical protein